MYAPPSHLSIYARLLYAVPSHLACESAATCDDDGCFVTMQFDNNCYNVGVHAPPSHLPCTTRGYSCSDSPAPCQSDPHHRLHLLESAFSVSVVMLTRVACVCYPAVRDQHRDQHVRSAGAGRRARV
jgi:hypothetical protein